MNKEDILEKGAICQRGCETFAVAPHIPGGFIRVADFKKLLDAAEKYNAQALKMTSGQLSIEDYSEQTTGEEESRGENG